MGGHAIGGPVGGLFTEMGPEAGYAALANIRQRMMLSPAAASISLIRGADEQQGPLARAQADMAYGSYAPHAYRSGGVVDLIRRFAEGGLVGGFTSAIAHTLAYANGGPVQAPTAPASLGHHELDIRTNAGQFTARVDEDTMSAIQNSSLGGKLTTTNPSGRPTWYS